MADADCVWGLRSVPGDRVTVGEGAYAGWDGGLRLACRNKWGLRGLGCACK
jgi:hypothetical protein